MHANKTRLFVRHLKNISKSERQVYLHLSLTNIKEYIVYGTK